MNANKNLIDPDMFWDLPKTLTYNALFNFILGIRGGGKSYGAKKRGIDNFIKRKEQFGYIRRYKDDLKEPMEQYFDDIMHEFPDYEFKTIGKKFYCRLKPADEKEKWTKDDICGYGFELSTANNKKSISYPFITTLIFDEFLIEKGNQRYLSNEPMKLLNLYETIARPGTGHPRVVLFLLANTISITNPYFLFWGLQMPTKADKNGKFIWRHPTRPMLVEDVRTEKFMEKKRETEFGEIVVGTPYADYSLDDKFLLDNNTFVEKKSPKSRYHFTFLYKDKYFGVWIDYTDGKMWVSESIDPSFPIVYALTLKDHQPNTLFLKTKGRSGHFKAFIENYKVGNVFFESINIKNMCYEVIQMVMN